MLLGRENLAGLRRGQGGDSQDVSRPGDGDTLDKGGAIVVFSSAVRWKPVHTMSFYGIWNDAYKSGS